MKRIPYLLALLSASALAQRPAVSPGTVTPTAAPQAIAVPREKVTLSCADSYFRSARENFLLLDENYPTCTLKLPLALHQRWPGERTFYVIPRVSASLLSRDDRGKARWTPLAPLVNPGEDPLHRMVRSGGYQAIELTGNFGKLSSKVAGSKPDTVSAGGKLTVCAAPVYRGEEPCKTFDVAARFKVYTR